MAGNINRVTLTGNLTRDAELRQTASGMAVLGFGMAVNDRRRNQQTGEWEDHANFVDCTMFGTRAQAVSQYLHKGDKVAVEGKLRYSSWERDGQKRSKLEVVVDEIEFMSGGARQQLQGAYQQPQAEYAAPRPHQQTQPAPQPYQQAPLPMAQPVRQPAPVQQPAPQARQAYYDDDIPF